MSLLAKGLLHPAYDACLKCSHVFNLLDARGAISVTERTGFIARVRALARGCAGQFLDWREKQGYPLLAGYAIGPEIARPASGDRNRRTAGLGGVQRHRAARARGTGAHATGAARFRGVVGAGEPPPVIRHRERPQGEHRRAGDHQERPAPRGRPQRGRHVVEGGPGVRTFTERLRQTS